MNKYPHTAADSRGDPTTKLRDDARKAVESLSAMSASMEEFITIRESLYQLGQDGSREAEILHDDIAGALIHLGRTCVEQLHDSLGLTP